MTTTPDKKAPIDWERVELDFRAGTLTLREIGEANGVSHTAIRKRAEKEGWTRDLNAKIKAKAEELVSKAEVSKTVSKEEAETKKVTENDRVLVDATRIANVKIGSRRQVAELERSVELAMQRVEVLLRDSDALQELGDLMDKGPDEKGRADKLNDLYRKVIDLPGAVKALKDVAETTEKLLKMKWMVHGIADATEPPPAPPSTTVGNETARRIAFILSKGLMAQKG